MENKNEIKQFNKKLLIVFLSILAIFTTLLVVKSQAMNVPAEIESLKQTERPNPTYLTYNDLIDYYDILCCQHGTALNGQGRVMLSGSSSNGGFNYDMGNWQDTGYSEGATIEKHTIYTQGIDFDSSSYTHRTYGYYSIIEQHIATPKEAYIIAEMKKELDIGKGQESSAEIIYENGTARAYSGSLVNAISMQLSTGEIAYTVNQKYVLKTPNGDAYYVSMAKDRDGNEYYVYETNTDGSLVKYTGNYTYKEPKTGREIECIGVNVDNVFYTYNGTISSGNTVASNNGTLYLVDYDMVIEQNNTLYYADITSDYNYIQIAWWSTERGGFGSVPNNLSVEAQDFQDYILEIAKKSSVSELKYENQSYSFTDESGAKFEGSVMAPVIDYHPGFNEDADQNGVVNEADQVTVSFDADSQEYRIGPFSLDYVYKTTHVEGRQRVMFSSIVGTKLISNLGELKYGADWYIDGNKGVSTDYLYPKPNERFDIIIKYKENLTEIKEFSFDFQYMNAGAELDIYDGNYNEVTWTVKHQDYNRTETVTDYRYNEATGENEPYTYNVEKFDHRDIWLQCTSVVAHDSQTLAHALKGTRWYNKAKCTKTFGLKSNQITIEKKVYDENGEDIIPIDRTYKFKIYINDKEFQELEVTTKNGVGEATSNKIYWTNEQNAPKYKIIEIGNYTNNGPWEGTLSRDNNIERFEAKNYLSPKTGTIELEKSLFNSTQALETEKFNFIVTITGNFTYKGQKYKSSEPLEIPVEIIGRGKWNSDEFKWYNKAPKYKVEEIIPDGAKYELLNGVVSGGKALVKNSVLREGNNITTATNTSTTDYTYVEIDKRMVSETSPQPGEVFKAKLTITGKFSYNNDEIKDRTETIEVLLEQNNNWVWNSEKIEWFKDEVPTYTLEEVEMAEGTTFVSISDEKISNNINSFESTLNPEKTLIIITNDRDENLIGRIQIKKLVETEDLYGKTFNFNVKVTGTFKYQGRQYNNETLEFPVEVTVDKKASNNKEILVGEWKSELFSWQEGTDAPKYSVEEVNLPEGSKFVSISNGTTTVTSSQTITGTLNGIKGNENDENSEAGKVIVTCTNTGTAKKQAHIVIIKESTDESIDDYVFFFKVKISGTFRYYNIVNPDGTIGYTQYTNETLVLDGSIDDVEAVCGGEDWVSELIVWDENDPNPTYSVEEISIPANIEFVSISNNVKTNSTPKIEGTLSEGTENNYITAINKPGPDFIDGSIRIVKKTNENLKGKIFHFDLKITGEFDYAGKHYDDNNPYILENIEVEANGNPWISGTVTWDEDKTAPKYEVKEVDVPEDVQFVSISNEKEICTDNSMTITGNLNQTKPVKIVAINYGGPTPNGSHIEITKEVLNEKLKGTYFYFNVDVTSTSPFRYHDLEDVTKVTEYAAGEHVKFEKVVAVADERDWVSGYFEWDEGASIPTYTISEITGAFPNGVKTVSLRNDTQILVKELDNTSSEDLVITGNLTGDITHIIAVNDADEDAPVQGKIVIEKKAISPIIDGEEFTFSLTITGKFKYQGKDCKKKEIKDIKITANGPKWESDVIEWYEKDGAPTYTVTEETATFADGTKFVSIRNINQTNTQPAITGTVEPHFNNWVIAENTVETIPNQGRIQIYKKLVDTDGNEINDVEFKFKITLTFADGTTREEIATVTSGKNWRSNWYYWNKTDSAPKYKIEEIDGEDYNCTITPSSGELVAQDSENGESGIVVVNATNTSKEEHKAKIRVNKELELNDKMSKDDVTASFQVLVKITGTFTYKGVSYNDQTLTLKVTLSKDNQTPWSWISKDICWVGDNAPEYIVEEPKETMPVGWHLESTTSSLEDNKLVDGGVAVVDIKNKWDYNEELILTMKLGGKVWDDTNRTLDKHLDAQENGIIDDGEPGISNVKVKIYRALVNKSNGQVVKRLDGVYAYDENDLVTLIDNVTYTDKNGNWSFGAVSVPAFIGDEEREYGENYTVTYDVEFEYDGQTYEPTEFLATAKEKGIDNLNERVNSYINSTTSERDNYLNNSMSIDDENTRNNFNKSFSVIQGNEPIDDEGNTLGKATGDGNEKDLYYTSVDSVSFFDSDNSRKVSTLKTIVSEEEENEVQKEGEIFNDLRISNSTSNMNLTFPFYTVDPRYDVTAWHLQSWDKIISDVFTIRYKSEAIYNYCLSINLGLVEREATDVAVEKDLTEALVVVNGKAFKYKFNTAIDLDSLNAQEKEELLYKQLEVADSQIEYRLGLYKGDYYYRASVYDADVDVKGALEGFYNKKFNVSGYDLTNTELDIYLKYTINVYNESETYDVRIGELADYYDSSFTLIEEPEQKYVQTMNGKEVDDVITVGEVSNVKWTESNERYTGSDNVEYKKITTSSLSDKKLATGEKASITVTFKVGKDMIGESGVTNTIKLGEKHNVAEITKFTSYYSEKSENRWSKPGDITGRVDEDSAPDNVNIKEYNEKSYYEDDTDSAPIITIGWSDEQRTISGIVWDDSQTTDVGYGQKVGNGIYNPDEGDKIISGLTTEIYESIIVPLTDENGNSIVDQKGNTIYKEYQFAWPTDSKIGNKTIEELTGFKQTTNTDKNGKYSFIGIPAGNYKVRYVYGDTKIETGNKGSEEIYNGQDYKTTAYQIGFDNDITKDGYLDNEWHDINNTKLSDLRVNDARDNEARRLYISSKSEILKFDNTSLLATADNKNSNHDELFGNYQDVKDADPVRGDGYYMYAETAKINLGVENVYSNTDDNSVNGNIKENGKDIASIFKYNIKNVDCGLEERSKTKLTLDKQIKEITLRTSDNNIILDAIYDIDYTLKSDGTIESKVSLNESASTGIEHIASLNRSKGNQGYRYVIAEGQILQGTTIEVKYQLTIFNMSETDRISKALDSLWTIVNSAETEELKVEKLNEALDAISTPLYTEERGRICKLKIDGSESFVDVGYGSLFGSVYYLGSQGVGVRPDEVIVKTKVHQMIDYLDPDIEFTDMNNISKDQSWANTEIEYLLENKLIDPEIVQILDKDGILTGKTAADREADASKGEKYSIVNDKIQEFISDNKNNLVLAINNGENQDTGSNPGFIKYLEPYMANKDVKKSTGTMSITVSRSYSSELDASDIDNLAEILQFENTAGRRDSRNIAGNANPYNVDGIYAAAQGKEKDASSTEVITLSPPTGLNTNESIVMQLIIVIAISMTLIAVSIVVIKKKVLIRK